MCSHCGGRVVVEMQCWSLTLLGVLYDYRETVLLWVIKIVLDEVCTFLGQDKNHLQKQAFVLEGYF